MIDAMQRTPLDFVGVAPLSTPVPVPGPKPLEGMLEKKKKKARVAWRGAWNELYFCIDPSDATLKYYKCTDDGTPPCSGAVPDGVIDMRAVHIVYVSTKADNPLQFSLSLAEGQVLLRAKNVDDTARWLRGLDEWKAYFLRSVEKIDTIETPTTGATALDDVSPPCILFVAPKLALTLFVAKWLYKRLENDGCGAQRKALERLYVMAAPDNVPAAQPQRRRSPHSVLSDSQSLVLYRVNAVGNRIVHTPVEKGAEVPTFSIVVIDEAHHLYRVSEKRDVIERLMAKGGAQRVLLSDISQSQGQDAGFPSDRDTVHVKLTEVVRSSKRIVAGAMAFQLGAEKNLTKCHHESGGPPLKTFLFDVEGDRHKKYGYEALRAIKAVIKKFPGLDLDDRLAIIVPDTKFEAALSPLLTNRLASELPTRQFELVSPEEAAAALPNQRRAGRSKQRLVLSPIDRFDGLERLIIIAVGLDAPVGDEEEDEDVLETRSRLYRAITRAHMMVCFFLSLMALSQSPPCALLICHVGRRSLS